MDLKHVGIALAVLCPSLGFAQDPESDALVEEFDNVLRETRGLERYNALRRRQIQMQEQDLADLEASINQVPELERQLPPLLITMVDGLNEFVELDLPFFTEERENRVAERYLIIEDPSVSDAQKLRRIIEAWLIEVQYGREVQAAEGQIDIPGVGERNVDFINLGRVAILFQTRDDEALTGAWDHVNGEWMLLPNEHRNPVRQAIRMARGQVAPDLLLLPVPPPEP